MADEFTVDSDRTVLDVTGVWNYVIAVGDHPVIWRRGNGQSFHMTYRSEANARAALGRVQQVLSEAQVTTR